ncbi:MAG TPA: serine hydrolase domain-containing protein, partial [Polyangiaceae bacterium]
MPGLRCVFALAAVLFPACAASPPPCIAPPLAIATTAPIAAPRPPVAAPAVDPGAGLAARVDPIFADFAKPGAISPGCAVGVYRAGDVVFAKGYGYADVEHDAPITDTTPFYTASLSKQFTAVAVLLLAADGNLEYDGSSNFVTTVRDLAKWDGNFYDPRIGGQALIDGMRVRGKLTDGTVLDYAMGLEEVESHGLHVEEHDGGFAG